MQHVTAIITHERPGDPYEAVALDFPLPAVTGRSLAEVKDRLVTAVQRHIDETCEFSSVCEPQRKVSEATSAQTLFNTHRTKPGFPRSKGFILEIPLDLLTRN